MKPPSIREEEFSIEIDVKRGKWPFVKFMWGQDAQGRTRLIIASDANESGTVVGQSQNISVIGISKKKAKRLARFIERTIDEVPD